MPRESLEKTWGQKNLWTNFDHYGFEDAFVRDGLDGGGADDGGASNVGCHSRDSAHDGLAVRLVLARKVLDK